MVLNTTVTLYGSRKAYQPAIEYFANLINDLVWDTLIKPLRMNIVSGVIEPSPMLPRVPNNMSSLSKASEYEKRPVLLFISKC